MVSAGGAIAARFLPSGKLSERLGHVARLGRSDLIDIKFLASSFVSDQDKYFLVLVKLATQTRPWPRK